MREGRTAKGGPLHAIPPRSTWRRCAILQFEARHEETLPSMIAAANVAGYYPHVFLHNRAKRRRGDIFAEVPGFIAEISYCNFGSDDGEGEQGAAGIAALERVMQPDIDFVVMNSFNRERGCAWARAIAKPVIAVVHNVDHFLSDAFSAPAVGDARFQFVTLGQHVLAELVSRIGKAQMDRIDVIEPCVWGFADPAPRGGSPRRIAIPGAINARTRDYAGLMAAIERDRAACKDLRFILGSGGKDRAGVEEEVRRRKLADFFEFLPVSGGDQVSHADYFASLRDAQAILPLMPDDFDQYQKIKITSSVSASVGFAVPMVMDRWSRACYRAPMMVADMGVAAAIDRLRGATEDDLQALRAELVTYRRAAMAENGRAFARLAARAVNKGN